MFLRRFIACLLAAVIVLGAASIVLRAAPACEGAADGASAEGCGSCGEAGDGTSNCPISVCTPACVAGPVAQTAAPLMLEPAFDAVASVAAVRLEPPARSSRPEPPPPR